MARIRVAGWIGGQASQRHSSRWLDVVDADALRRQIAGLVDPHGSGCAQAWEVLAYDGLPDFGPHPDLDELLAWLDAVDEYGAPFEAWWSTQSFGRVIEAAGAFADHYQGTYADRASWAQHTFDLMGGGIDADADLEAYARAAEARGEVQFIGAEGGGIHAFWVD